MRTTANARSAWPFLESIGACQEAREWAGDRSLSGCWAECERADWLMWLVGRMADKPGWPTRKDVVLAACAIAETVLPLVKAGEDRPRLAIEAARAWVRGEATLKQVRAAAVDAAAAAATTAATATAAAYAADVTVAAGAAAYAAAAAAAYAAAAATAAVTAAAAYTAAATTAATATAAAYAADVTVAADAAAAAVTAAAAYTAAAATTAATATATAAAYAADVTAKKAKHRELCTLIRSMLSIPEAS